MNLFKIIDELEQHKQLNKEDLLQYYINKRLNESLSSYYSELSKSFQYFDSSKKELRVLKKVNDSLRI